jgi:hypothetical protein
VRFEVSSGGHSGGTRSALADALRWRLMSHRDDQHTTTRFCIVHAADGHSKRQLRSGERW